MNQEIIQFIGVKDLESSDQATVQRLSSQYHEKIKGMLNNLTSLSVHIKVGNPEGNRKRYNLNIKVISATQPFESSNEDWDLTRILHKGFDDVMASIRHKLRVDEQRPRPER